MSKPFSSQHTASATPPFSHFGFGPRRSAGQASSSRSQLHRKSSDIPSIRSDISGASEINEYDNDIDSAIVEDVINPHVNFEANESAKQKDKLGNLDGINMAQTSASAPKRGRSAYMLFADEQREKVREENPGIMLGEVSKAIGEMWKGLSEKQRAPYEAKVAADKVMKKRWLHIL